MCDCTRRRFTHRLLGGTALFLLAARMPAGAAEPAVAKFEIERSPEEWRQRLTPQQYAVLREHDTELAFSHPYDKLYAPGVYHCAGCDLPLYSSTTKYDSGTGWPSFWKALDGAVGTREDRSWFVIVRTEVHCRRCGGHLGHVFDDGPPPTGLRHCLNGAALKFVPAAAPGQDSPGSTKPL